MNLTRPLAAFAASSLILTAGVAGVAAATGGDHKVTLCHNGHTITVDKHAAYEHISHGDTKGPCKDEPSEPTEKPSEPTEKPSEPTEKPSEPTEKPSEPTEKPSEPTEKPNEPTEKPSEPTEKPSEPSKPTTPVVPTKPTDEPVKSKPQKEVEKKATGKNKPVVGKSTKYDRDGNGEVDQFYAPSGEHISETG